VLTSGFERALRQTPLYERPVGLAKRIQLAREPKCLRQSIHHVTFGRLDSYFEELIKRTLRIPVRTGLDLPTPLALLGQQVPPRTRVGNALVRAITVPLLGETWFDSHHFELPPCLTIIETRSKP
jgi:hypothetical protein